MSRTHIAVRIAVPGILLAGLGVGLLAYRSGGAATGGPVTAAVTEGDVVQAISTTGTLEAVTTVQVGSQVSGTVKDLLADYNDIVREGQVLARLDPSLFDAQIDQSSASLAKAKADAEQASVALESARTTAARVRTLASRGLVAKADLDAAEIDERTAATKVASANALVTQALASLSQAKVSRAHTVITSPIDGIVIARSVDAGQTVAASMSAPTLFILAADLTKMRVIAKCDESDVSKVREGMGATFRVDAYPGQTFSGRVSQVRLQPETVSNVVTYTTVVDVANPRLELKPGMTANVSLTVARAEGTLRVPTQALRFRPTADQVGLFGAPGVQAADSAVGKKERGSPTGVATLWRFDGQVMRPLTVVAGISDGVTTAVSSADLRADDRVVTMIAGTEALASKAGARTTANPLIGGGPGPMGPPPR